MRKTTKTVAVTPYTKQLLLSLVRNRDTMDDVIMKLLDLYYKIRRKQLPPPNQED